MNDDFNLVLKAFESACIKLKLTQQIQCTILGNNTDGMDLDALSKVELAEVQDRCLSLIELHNKLYVLSGNNDKFIQYLLSTKNTALKGKPINLIQTPDGLKEVLDYYSAMSS